MSDYLLSIVGIVLLSGILFAIMPDGKTARLIKTVTKIGCLTVILSPVLVYFTKKSDNEADFSLFYAQTGIETDASFIDYCSSERVENACTELKKKIGEKFSLDVGVSLQWEYERDETDNFVGFGNFLLDGYGEWKIKITEVLLTFSAGTTEDGRAEVVDYLSEICGCEVKIV